MMSRPLARCRLIAGMLALVAGTTPALASTRWRRPATVSGFHVIRPELKRLADEEGRQRLNHFCAVVRDVREPPSPTSEGDTQVLMVYWPEGQRIYSYGPSDNGRITAENGDAGAAIDLARDVVATPEQINGSTKRVTRAYVHGVIAHCRTTGTRYVAIRRSR